MLPDWVLERILALQNVVDNFLVGFATEGRLSAQHDEEDDSHAPVVTLGGVAAFQNLRSDVVRGSVGSRHDLVLGDTLRQTEVDELDVRVVVFLKEEEILRLNVSANARKS